MLTKKKKRNLFEKMWDTWRNMVKLV